MQNSNNKSVRLSKNVVPIRYEIELKPDLENFTFFGRETIYLSILPACRSLGAGGQKTRIITLHCKEIEIDTAHMSDMWGKISYSVKKETATFTFPKPIPVGKHKLTLIFRGILNDKMRGFYRSRYSIGEKEYHMATTQFEATDARRAFPCFDEPAQKAVFHISLVVPKGKTAISNTLPVSVHEHPARNASSITGAGGEAGYDIIEFSPTPLMSTYLLAFIVGDFEFIEKTTSPLPLRRGSAKGKGVKVRIFTTPGKKHQAKFALECAVKILEFYEKYFAIKFPLPALDLIAIPDFSSGAMENWGAITYRESALLVDEEHSSASNKQWVALVIAHELAHQWFGNLVTMEWWTHLWLNEGFASYIEYLAVDKLFPKWDIWTQFATEDLGRALRLDALATTHPIEVEVHHPNEIGEIFDEVSYSKGASIIRMLAAYLGEKDFRDGLRHYLKKHSYKNTKTLHLWQAFEKVSGKPVAKMMKNWTSKPGYPVIKLEIKNDELQISQERFFASPISAKKAKNPRHGGASKTKWQIPIVFKNNKVNFGETGFYRTAYSKEQLRKLRAPIQNKKFSARDRLGIIRDLFALSEAGTIPTTDALEFLSAYKGENNYTVWVEIATGLARLEQLISRTTLDIKMRAFELTLFSPLARKMGWQAKKNEPHTHTLLRSLAIARTGHAGNKNIIKEARKKFAQIVKGKHISPDIRGAIYSVVADWGRPKEFNAFIKLYKKETLHEEKNRIGANLGDFKNKKLLEKACEFAMSKYVRPQDTMGILSSVGANPLGRDIWWNFIQKNWKTLVSRYGEGGLNLARVVRAIGGSAEQKHFTLFKKFFATHPAPGASRAISQVLERLEGNIAWLKRDKKVIQGFLARI